MGKVLLIKKMKNNKRSKEKNRLVNFPQNTGYNIKARANGWGWNVSLTYFFTLFFFSFTYKALHRILKKREIKTK